MATVARVRVLKVQLAAHTARKLLDVNIRLMATPPGAQPGLILQTLSNQETNHD
jgi:hypothetical protein